jgi:integrase/recombinase XerC
MTITDENAIRLYDADMAFRNLLLGTRNIRARYLAKFSREVGFAEATEQKIITWLGRDISAKTRNMWISTLAAFYHWALKGDNGQPVYPPNDDGTAFDPTSSISKPRMHPRQPRPIPSDDLKLALANATPLMTCWLLLAALAGCRCQEIAGIEREDIYEDTMRLHIVKGKGDKERWGVLHADVLGALRALPMRSSGPLWDETAASVSRKGNKYLHSLGIKSTMHTLRHYFGTSVYRASKDLRLTQELMGHSSPQTTAGYAAADQSQAAGIVGNLSI